MIAKCDACHEVYTWNGPLRLKDARCPVHHTPLARTTYLSQWPRSRKCIDMSEAAHHEMVAKAREEASLS
jgi:hypothetical protein